MLGLLDVRQLTKEKYSVRFNFSEGRERKNSRFVYVVAVRRHHEDTVSSGAPPEAGKI